MRGRQGGRSLALSRLEGTEAEAPEAGSVECRPGR